MSDWQTAPLLADAHAAANTPKSDPRRVYVTGASGFVGGWVQRVAGEFPGWQVVPAPADLDLLDLPALTSHLRDSAPHAVIHLAAQSSVADSLRDPVSTCRINVLGTQCLLHALGQIGFSGRLIYVSSGDVYGDVPAGQLPVSERQPAAPRSPYAASKVAAEVLCLQWARVGEVQAVVARPFNHFGPGQDRRFALAEFAAQIAAMSGRPGPHRLVAGDLDVTRDFLDVRDVVRAYFALLTGGQSGQTYNICSGRELRLRDIVLRMAALAGIDLDITTDPARLRPAEQRRMVGDSTALQADTAWRPQTTIDQTLGDLLASLAPKS